MTEHADAASSSSDAAAQRASEQARLRRERREARIKSGGADRLNKITGIGGRVVGETDPATPVVPAEPAEPAAATTSPETTTPSHADPDEIDISQHFYGPNATSRRVPAGAGADLGEAQLRQMMLGFDRPRPGQSSSGTPGSGSMPNMEDDPMMKMMAQMMGGAGGPGSSPFPGMPPTTGLPGQQSPPQPSPYHTIWRLIHALVALGLGFYLALFTTFSGTRAEREAAAVAHHQQHLAADDENERRRRIFFWTFATSEAVLLTTRLLLDKGRAPPPGLMWTIVGFIPEPFKGYLAVGLKYGQIFTTVRTDILTCMFVLGVCSWLRA
ncbi:hypothetical protein EsDP_00003344 [Epichloe bromicola]|uniref:Uncharacterized protein n=1 Tax=Epichloe bromicola TaxID=79588 RepID=A0ABQ0CNY0_9HYPO